METHAILVIGGEPKVARALEEGLTQERSLVLVDRDGTPGATFRIQIPRSDGGSS